MAAKINLTAEERLKTGKRASRRLRRGDKVIATIYGAQKPPASIKLEFKNVLKALEDPAFYSSILTLHVDKQPEEKVVVKAIHRHPYKSQIIHMDFLRIDPKEKLTMMVPLSFKGETLAPGVKAGGVVSRLINEIEIRCLPADLPENIEVDLSGLEMGQYFYLSNLKLPTGVELIAFTHGNVEEHNQPIANVHEPHVIKEPEVPAEPVSAEVAATRVASDKEKAEQQAAEAAEKSK